jgi:hypothetical protein
MTTALWVWRGLLVAALAWSVLALSGLAVAVIALLVLTEILVRRQRGSPTRGSGMTP